MQEVLQNILIQTEVSCGLYAPNCHLLTHLTTPAADVSPASGLCFPPSLHISSSRGESSSLCEGSAVGDDGERRDTGFLEH